MKECNCSDWIKYYKLLQAILSMAYSRSMPYTGKMFKHCPWCGKELK